MVEVRPWSPQRAGEMKTRLDSEAAIIAARTGASHVVVIAFYPDGDNMHVLDAGTTPMPRSELYPQLAAMVKAFEEGRPADVKLQ